MNHYVLRVEKVHSASELKGRAGHIQRQQGEREYLDNESTADDTHLLGGTSEEQTLAMWREDLPDSYRKDAVLAGEIVVGGSPAWFEGASREEQDAYFRDALEWVKERHGEENILTAYVHRDEATPHMHVMFTPIRERETDEGETKKSLSFKSYYGGRSNMSKVQDDFHRNVAERHGFDRGEVGSRAKHTTTRQYQGALRRNARDAAEAYNGWKSDPKRIKELREEGLSRKEAPIREAFEAGYAHQNVRNIEKLFSLRDKREWIERINKVSEERAVAYQKLAEKHDYLLDKTDRLERENAVLRDDQGKLQQENQELRRQLQNASSRIKTQREANIWAVNRLKDIDYEKTPADRKARTDWALRQIQQANINSPAHLQELRTTYGNWELPGTPGGAPLLPHQQKARDMARGMGRGKRGDSDASR
jgi:hypothetical protein